MTFRVAPNAGWVLFSLDVRECWVGTLTWPMYSLHVVSHSVSS